MEALKFYVVSPFREHDPSPLVNEHSLGINVNGEFSGFSHVQRVGESEFVDQFGETYLSFTYSLLHVSVSVEITSE